MPVLNASLFKSKLYETISNGNFEILHRSSLLRLAQPTTFPALINASLYVLSLYFIVPVYEGVDFLLLVLFRSSILPNIGLNILVKGTSI